MGRGRLLLLALTAALAAVAAPAMAGKKVPSAEQGAVPLVAGAPLGLEAPVTVQPGEIAWRESLRPERNVRLIDGVKARVRPGAPAVPAGTLLFGYRLGSGVAYCPASDPQRGTAKVQCFRDFNRDGRFEGGYVTDWQDSGSRYLAGYVHALGPVGGIRYERVEAAETPPVEGGYIFSGFRNGVAQFRLSVEGSTMDNTTPCEPEADGACRICGLTLKITPDGKAARITLIAASPERLIQINMTGLSLPGSRP
ncbi:MAG: hypothetical protein GC145_02145 [Caulobacter sp.]|nr:hypothetical protein [Caulobacter sp.]